MSDQDVVLKNVNNENGTITIVNGVLPSPLSDKYTQLLKSLERDIEDCKKSEEIIDNLEHYMSQHHRYRRDLSQKLVDSGFVECVDDAEDCKELINKLITKYKYFKSGQQLIVALLADAEFNYSINKKALKELSNKTYSSLESFLCQIIDEMFKEFRIEASTIFRKDHFLGLFFYLAGHCHIDFDL